MNLMWNYILGFIFLFNTVASYAGTETQVTETISLQMCQDDDLQIRFLCDPEWGLESADGVLAIFIEEDASVLMTLTRSEDSVLFLEQLRNPILRQIGNYETNFSTASTLINGQEALVVKGHSEGAADVFLYDIYIIWDLSLYLISFSLKPSDRWEYYRPLVERISASLEFSEI